MIADERGSGSVFISDPRSSAFICGLFTGDFRDAAGVFVELARVIEPGEVFLQRGVLNARADLAEDLLLQPVTVIVALADCRRESELVDLGRRQPAAPRGAINSCAS